MKNKNIFIFFSSLMFSKSYCYPICNDTELNLFNIFQEYLPYIEDPTCIDFINYISSNTGSNLSAVCNMDLISISSVLYYNFYGYLWNTPINNTENLSKLCKQTCFELDVKLPESYLSPSLPPSPFSPPSPLVLLVL